MCAGKPAVGDSNNFIEFHYKKQQETTTEKNYLGINK